MPTDFLDAHFRHHEDAEVLYCHDRWANADHLYGMSAECGLKRLMLAFGMPFDISRDSPSRSGDKKHIDKIWDRYETYRSGHMPAASYTLSSSTPFVNWRAEHRYDHQSGYDQSNIDTHRLAADDINDLIKKAQIDGLI